MGGYGDFFLIGRATLPAGIPRASAFLRPSLPLRACPGFSLVLTRKTIALARRTFVGKVMSLLFHVLSRLVLAFLPRSKRLLISWLQPPSAGILEPKRIKSLTVSRCFAASLRTLSIGLFSVCQLESTAGCLHPGAGNGVSCVLMSIFRNTLWFSSLRGITWHLNVAFLETSACHVSPFVRGCPFLLLFDHQAVSHSS